MILVIGRLETRRPISCGLSLDPSIKLQYIIFAYAILKMGLYAVKYAIYAGFGKICDRVMRLHIRIGL